MPENNSKGCVEMSDIEDKWGLTMVVPNPWAKRLVRQRQHLSKSVMRHHAVLIGTEEPWGKAYKSPFWCEDGETYFELRYGRVRMKGLKSSRFRIDGPIHEFVSRMVQAIDSGDFDDAIELTAPKPPRSQLG